MGIHTYEGQFRSVVTFYTADGDEFDEACEIDYLVEDDGIEILSIRHSDFGDVLDGTGEKMRDILVGEAWEREGE